MVLYRRNRVAGGCYFFTVTLRDRQSRLLTDHIHLLRNAFRKTQQQSPFDVNAIVVLPDHLHTIWTLPEGDTNYSGRWQSLKSHFTRKVCTTDAAISQNTKGEYNLWQHRFWEHTLRDTNDLKQHIDYIHYNPVKHGHVDSVANWPWSSFHRFVRQGKLPLNWAGNGEHQDERFGE